MKSLQTRIIISFLGLLAVFGMLLGFGVNYMEKEYYHQKIAKMIQTGSQIRTRLQVATSDREAKESLDYLGYQFEGRITILDIRQDGAYIIYKNQKFFYNTGEILREIPYQGETAWILRTDYPVANSLWLGILIAIDENRFAWLEIPIPTIEESIEVFRRYISRAMLLGGGFSVFLAYFLARSITRPIRRLKELAGKIGKLDFEEKYEGKRQDEIGELGSTLNEITLILKETIDNLQRELSQKKKLEIMRKRFVAQVSHELQTPISVISSYAEALSDGMAGEESAEYYVIILDECRKMSVMVKDLLELSALESGTMHYHKDVLGLDELLEKMIKKQERIVMTEGKFIVRELFPVQIVADATRLEQALGNILSNSIKHAETKVSVRMLQNGDRTVLQIRNDGEQLKEEELPFLWDSFFKGKNKKAGTGLGLAIASEILKAHQVKYSIYNADTENEVVYELQFMQ